MLYPKKTIDANSDPNWHKFESGETYDYGEYRLSWSENIFPKTVGIPENGIYRIPDGIVFFDGLSLTSDKEMLADLHWLNGEYHTSPTTQKSFNQKITNLQQKKGSCLNLSTYFGNRNYFHCILDSFSKLEIVEGCSPIELGQFDYVFLPKNPFKNAQILIDFFKIPRDKTLWADSKTQYQFTELYTPSLRGKPIITRVGSLGRIKKAFPIEDKKPYRKIYVCRNGYTKNIENENEIWSILEKRGFEKIDPAKEPDSFKIFNEAEMIVGAQGAGLTDMFFCQPNTKVLEMVPLFVQQPYYMSLAHAASLNYSAMFCGKEGDFEKASTSTFQELFAGGRKNFYVDPVKFTECLEAM